MLRNNKNNFLQLKKKQVKVEGNIADNSECVCNKLYIEGEFV